MIIVTACHHWVERTLTLLAADVLGAETMDAAVSPAT